MDVPLNVLTLEYGLQPDKAGQLARRPVIKEKLKLHWDSIIILNGILMDVDNIRFHYCASLIPGEFLRSLIFLSKKKNSRE